MTPRRRCRQTGGQMGPTGQPAMGPEMRQLAWTQYSCDTDHRVPGPAHQTAVKP